MLDENLPTFQFKPSSDNPLSSVVYFTQNGSEPAPEYVFKRADPSNPAARRKYAVALADPYAPDVVYAEVVVEPEWSQPTLSAAEIRAQQHQNGGASLAPQPMIPDNFTIYLYNPDQAVSVKYIPGSLTKSDSWEFEMLSQSFKMPSNSQLDRQKQNGEPVADFRPRVMFRWKKDGRLSKDMTCFNVGKSVGKHKSKEPDITVALFKQGRATAVTVYEPNLQRIDMEDRKGLDIVLVIGTEVIRDLYLAPDKRPDLFNVGATGPLPISNGRRKNSRPSPPPAGPVMAGALGPSAPQAQPLMSTANVAASSSARPSNAAIDAETERLKAMVEREEKERQAAKQREDRERERRDREEQKRIKQMLDDEEKEKRQREAEIAKETERLKKLYGTEGQDINPPLPSRPQYQGRPPQQQQQQQHPPPQGGSWNFAPPPQRPTSVGPGTGPFHSSTLNHLFAGRPSGTPAPQAGPSKPGRTKPNQGPYLSGANPAAAVSGFFSGLRKDDRKITKKKSMQW
ncbi:hypothetical protein N8I77_008151 [Diaporthe amygdali]|uniref:Uncharacterized protein n=1 Tax=Phomopsis amygdali TaxID=1214568 RepID=A0AAD9W460_PHOAM|nr:hypothetical protein N8I77_008151 [Diaporthe amygdali]